jgi:hypothetical protein
VNPYTDPVGLDGQAVHYTAARECLQKIEARREDPEVAPLVYALSAMTHAQLALVEEIRDLRATLVQAVDDLREAVEAVELGVGGDDEA